MTAAPHPSARRSAFALFLFLFSLYVFTSSGRVRVPDEYVVFYQTESLVTRHSLTIPQAFVFGNFYGMLDRFRQPRAPYPPGQALAAVPFFIAGKALARVVNPASYTAAWYLVAYVTSMSSALLTAATIAVVFLLLLRLGFSHRASLLTSLWLGLTTMLWPYAGYFFSEPLTCLLLALAALALFSAKNETDSLLSYRRAFGGALLLAALLWVRPTHIFAIVVICAALFAAYRPAKLLKPLLVISAVVGVSLGLYLLQNRHLYGGFFHFGYPEYSNGTRRLNSFTTPAHIGLLGFLFSPGKSIFIYMPMIVLGIAGLKRFWQRSRGLCVVAVFLPLVYLLFYMRYAQWEGGRCLGPRYLMPALLFLCCAAAPVFELELEWGTVKSKVLTWTIGVFGFAVQAVSMATSFLEAQEGRNYYDAAYNYRFAYCQLCQQAKMIGYYSSGMLPQKLGLGWDRWFVFLREAGLPAVLIAAIVAIEILCVVGFGWRVWQDDRLARRSLQNMQSSAS